MIFTYDNNQHSFACIHKSPTMRRTFSSTYLASPTSSSEWCFACKKLNIIAFAGTLVYLGYLLGCLNDDRVVPAPLLTRGGRKYGSNELQASSAIADAPSSGEQSHQEVTNREVAPTPLVIEERPPTRVYANGPVIYIDKGPATSINLIGERHSGTNWITDHLVACVRFTSCFGFIFAFLMMETNQSYLYRFMFLTVRRPDSCKYMEEICLK